MYLELRCSNHMNLLQQCSNFSCSMINDLMQLMAYHLSQGGMFLLYLNLLLYSNKFLIENSITKGVLQKKPTALKAVLLKTRMKKLISTSIFLELCRIASVKMSAPNHLSTLSPSSMTAPKIRRQDQNPPVISQRHGIGRGRCRGSASVAAIRP